MFKRVGLFLIINILMMIVINVVFTIVVQVFDLGPLMTVNGVNYTSLMAMCLVWGMGGSFVSLFISKWMAKKMMGVQIVDQNPQYTQLVQTIHHLSKSAGLDKMPEVGVYNSPEINAFATGASKNSSLVAVSTGLLEQLNESERDGVLAHEVAHIANGDMVTMALIQGIVNAFVYFFAWIATMAIENALRSDDDEGRGGLGYFASYFIRSFFITIFGILALPIVNWFSRWREYRADAGSARIGGREKMISALEALKRNYASLEPEGSRIPTDSRVKAMQISSKASFNELFSTHPSLDKRIAALREMRG
jgi:heat shock protein HtpX